MRRHSWQRVHSTGRDESKKHLLRYGLKAMEKDTMLITQFAFLVSLMPSQQIETSWVGNFIWAWDRGPFRSHDVRKRVFFVGRIFLTEEAETR